MRRLRAPSGPDTLQRVQLGGVEYQLRWRWIQRAERWALDVRSASGELLAGGIRVVANLPLLEAARAGRDAGAFPPGELLVHDSRSSGREPPGLTTLGTDALPLLYLEAA